MRALFLYNSIDLNSNISGGVQICSQQFLEIIKEMADEFYFFEVDHNKSIIFRLLHRLNLDAYLSYDPTKYQKKLTAYLEDHQITHLFINKAELLKFSKLIKESDLKISPKIIIMSHGNESGDLLGDLTEKKSRFKYMYKYFGILRLGMAVYLESWYRKRYVDLVCTMSDEESAIEKWLGINNPFFIPRLITQNENISRNPHQNIFGYVGTLNHTPNINALYQLCEKISEANITPEIRIVGGPSQIGRQLAEQYSFVNYLGVLNDDELLEEIKIWSFFINPIFNYSRGASMKLAKAIEWEIPVITTVAGRRGYFFKEGKLIETEDNSTAMVNKIKSLINIDPKDYETFQTNIRKIKYSTPNASDIAKILKNKLQNI